MSDTAINILNKSETYLLETALAKEAAEKARQLREKAEEKTKEIQRKWREIRPRVSAARDKTAIWYERSKENIAESARRARSAYRSAVDTIRDPEVRREASEAIGAMMEIRRQIKETKREGTYRGLTLLASVPVETRYGQTTMGEMATSRLLERYPSLRETNLCDDPAATMTAVICRDRKYFVNEVRLIKHNGNRVSINEAIKSSSPFDGSKAIQYLAILEAAEDVGHCVSTGEDGLEALGSFATAIEAVNEGEDR